MDKVGAGSANSGIFSLDQLETLAEALRRVGGAAGEQEHAAHYAKGPTAKSRAVVGGAARAASLTVCSAKRKIAVLLTREI